MIFGWHWFYYRGLLDAELERKLSPTERIMVLRDIPNHLTSGRFFSKSSWRFAPLLIMNCAMIAGARLTLDKCSPVQKTLIIAGVVIVGIASIPWSVRRQNAKAFYAAVRNRGHDICPNCGYWLRNLDAATTHCPECGTKRLDPPRTLSGPASSAGRSSFGTQPPHESV